LVGPHRQLAGPVRHRVAVEAACPAYLVEVVVAGVRRAPHLQALAVAEEVVEQHR
jgi:predicted nucleic acid-binding Zn finger protein